MNSPEEIKRILTPIMVAQHYLGSGSQKGNKVWYKSPFRNERTASFMATNNEFHDFGDGWHGDVIDFVGKYYNTDFINSMKILTRDFRLPDDKPISQKLEQYLKSKRDEQQRLKNKLNEWYCDTLNKLCENIQLWEKMIPLLSGDALAIAYDRQAILEYLIDEFINATEDEKIELWKVRNSFEKYIN